MGLKLFLILSIIIFASCGQSSKTNIPDNKLPTAETGSKDSITPQPGKAVKNNSITKIAFATGGCEGTCPLQSYQLDGSLTLSYFGGMYAEKQGFYKGQISRELWEKIVQKVDSFAPGRLEDRYFESEDDNRMQIAFCYGERKKIVSGSVHKLPGDFKTLFGWLAAGVKNVKLEKTEEVIIPETSMQFTRMDRLKYAKEKNKTRDLK